MTTETTTTVEISGDISVREFSALLSQGYEIVKTDRRTVTLRRVTETLDDGTVISILGGC